MNDIAIEPAAQPIAGLRTSPEIDKLAAALAIAQGAWENPPRDREVTVQTRTGGSYKFKYATLSAVLDATRKPLAENGLSITHIMIERNGRNRLISRLMHASGQWMESEFPLFVSEQTNQALGSALTYAKRYSRCALLDIAADEDDDGNAADGNHAQQRERVQKGKPQVQPRPAATAKPEPPHDPETGEIKRPHAIPMPQGATGTDRAREWGAQFVAAVKTAASHAEIDQWEALNKLRLDELKLHSAVMHGRVSQTIAAHRSKLGRAEPEMVGPDEAEGVLR